MTNFNNKNCSRAHKGNGIDMDYLPNGSKFKLSRPSMDWSSDRCKPANQETIIKYPFDAGASAISSKLWIRNGSVRVRQIWIDFMGVYPHFLHLIVEGSTNTCISVKIYSGLLKSSFFTMRTGILWQLKLQHRYARTRTWKTAWRCPKRVS